MRKIPKDLVRPCLRTRIETTAEVRWIHFRKSLSVIISRIDTAGTEMHPVDASFSAFLKQNKRTRDVTPECLFLMIFAPVDIGPARFACGVDHHVRLLLV